MLLSVFPKQRPRSTHQISSPPFHSFSNKTPSLSFPFLYLDFIDTNENPKREKKGKMLLGKRPRPPMRRTTSMTEFSVDLSSIEPQPSDQRGHHHKTGSDGGGGVGRRQMDSGYAANVSPRGQRKSSGDFLETAPFLRACGLCKRRLAPGRDIYMYRGDTAFCSSECRQQQMNQDERREKCSLSSMKKEIASSSAAESGSEAAASSNGETMAAA